jgi:uroporphyrinogen-III synthase
VDALHEQGIPFVIVPSERFDSEGLLAQPELQDAAGKHVMIFRGDGGRELLGDTLKARGADVEYVTCYLRSKPGFDAGALLAARPDAIIVTSSEALRHLWEMLNEQERASLVVVPLVVPHERIAEAARQQGWRHVVATGPGDDGLIAGLIAWAQANRNRCHE